MIKFEKIYPTNELKGINEEQENQIPETEIIKSFEEETKDQEVNQIQTRFATKASTKLSREGRIRMLITILSYSPMQNKLR